MVGVSSLLGRDVRSSPLVHPREVCSLRFPCMLTIPDALATYDSSLKVLLQTNRSQYFGGSSGVSVRWMLKICLFLLL